MLKKGTSVYKVVLQKKRVKYSLFQMNIIFPVKVNYSHKPPL